MPFDLSFLIIVFLIGLLIVALSIAGLFNSLFVKNKKKYSAIILFSSCIICSIYLVVTSFMAYNTKCKMLPKIDSQASIAAITQRSNKYYHVDNVQPVTKVTKATKFYLDHGPDLADPLDMLRKSDYLQKAQVSINNKTIDVPTNRITGIQITLPKDASVTQLKHALVKKNVKTNQEMLDNLANKHKKTNYAIYVVTGTPTKLTRYYAGKQADLLKQKVLTVIYVTYKKPSSNWIKIN